MEVTSAVSIAALISEAADQAQLATVGRAIHGPLVMLSADPL